VTLDWLLPPHAVGLVFAGGVITSTVLTLLVIPTVHDLMSEWGIGRWGCSCA
jgi:Cu/Ag efflux pump CusA